MRPFARLSSRNRVKYRSTANIVKRRLSRGFGFGFLLRDLLIRGGISDEAQSARVTAVPVCTENLNPNVLTMKSAQYGARIYDAGSLNLARDRRILVQCPMRSHAGVD